VLDWNVAVSNAISCRLDHVWHTCCIELFSQIIDEHPNASVLINIYTPLCLPETLYHITKNGDHGFIPVFHIVANEEDGNEGWLAVGFIQWDGKTCPSSPELFFEELSGGAEKYHMQMHDDDVWWMDSEAMRLHGFKYNVVRLTMNNGKVDGEILSASLDSWDPINLEEHVSNIVDFAKENREYLSHFADTIDEHVCRV
jgi:hypothetical protein